MQPMNTNSNKSGSVEALSSTLSSSNNSLLQSTDTTVITRTINNTNNSNNNHQSSNSSIRHFACIACNIDFSNQKQFNSHLNSRQHQQAQSIHDVIQSVAPEYRPAYKTMLSVEMLNKKVLNRQLNCEQELDHVKKPLLGLNYIIEFQFENLTEPPRYICDLCQTKFSFGSLLSHLLNIQHYQKFFKINHPDMYERVLSASSIRSEQQRLIENYARQIQSRHGGPGHVQLHVQLDSYIGQKPIVFGVIFRSQSGQKSNKKPSIQLITKTYEEYDYPYEEVPVNGNENFTDEQARLNHEDSIQRGLSPEDLLYPFDRQYWYQNYKDLLGSRPIDPHSVTYQEIIPESNNLQPFQGISKTSDVSSVSINSNGNPLTLENGQTIRRNSSQPSNRRVILDTNRTPSLNPNGILRISPTKAKQNFDGYSLLNVQQKETNGTHAVLNEQNARAILAASGLLHPDEEDEQNQKKFNSSSIVNNEESKKNSDQTVSPLIAKRMLDAVLKGDLDVVHIQPYFSTFVHLIQTGQVELERHQAERLLHKVLVTSAPSPSSTIKNEPQSNSNKRARSNSRSEECTLSSTSLHRMYEDYRSSTDPNPKRYLSSSSSSSSSSSTTRRVQLTNDNNIVNGKRSVD